MLNTNNNVDSGFSVVNMDGESKDYIAQVLNDQKDPSSNIQPPISPATMLENLNPSPHNMSSMNFLQLLNNYGENRNAKNMFLEGGTSEPMIMNHDDPFDPNSEENVGFDHEMDMALQGQMTSESMNKGHLMEQLETAPKKHVGNDMNRSDSVSDCSDQNDEEDDPKCRRRNGNTLRSLVPKITKLDRASILKDAMEYVMELKRQVEDLQNELEENSDDNEGTANNQSTIVEQEVMYGNGSNPKRRYSHQQQQRNGMFVNGTQLEAYLGNVDQDIQGANDKGQQMEPQVEVASLDGNEFFVKVFCEHKPGGFVRLMLFIRSLTKFKAS